MTDTEALTAFVKANQMRLVSEFTQEVFLFGLSDAFKQNILRFARMLKTYLCMQVVTEI